MYGTLLVLFIYYCVVVYEYYSSTYAQLYYIHLHHVQGGTILCMCILILDMHSNNTQECILLRASQYHRVSSCAAFIRLFGLRSALFWILDPRQLGGRMRWYDRRRSGLLFFCLPRTHPLGVRSGNLQSGRRTKGKFCSELQIPNKSRSPVPARRLSAIRHGHVLEEYVSYVEMLKGMKDNCQDTYTLLDQSTFSQVPNDITTSQSSTRMHNNSQLVLCSIRNPINSMDNK